MPDAERYAERLVSAVRADAAWLADAGLRPGREGLVQLALCLAEQLELLLIALEPDPLHISRLAGRLTAVLALLVPERKDDEGDDDGFLASLTALGD